MGSGHRAVRRADLHLRTGCHINRRRRRCRLDCDRSVPFGDRAAPRGGADRHNGRGLWPQSRASSSGFWPWVRDHLEPWIQDTPLGFLPVFGTPSQAGILRRPCPHDHDRPDHVVISVRASPSASRTHGRCPRARLDAVGGDPRCRLHLRRHRRGGPAWPGDGALEAIAVNQTIGNHNAIPTFAVFRARRLPRKQGCVGVRGRHEPAAGFVDSHLAAILMVISLAASIIAQFMASCGSSARWAV